MGNKAVSQILEKQLTFIADVKILTYSGLFFCIIFLLRVFVTTRYTIHIFLVLPDRVAFFKIFGSLNELWMVDALHTFLVISLIFFDELEVLLSARPACQNR